MDAGCLFCPEVARAVCQLPHLPRALEQRRGRRGRGFVEGQQGVCPQTCCRAVRAGLWVEEGRTDLPSGPGCWWPEKVWWGLTRPPCMVILGVEKWVLHSSS